MNSDQEIIGALGVIGPTRLNYARVIPLVDYTPVSSDRSSMARDLEM